MDLVPHETVNAMFLCKTFDYVILVFVNPFYDIRCYTSIKCPIPSAAKNIDIIGFHALFLDSRLRGNDTLKK